MKIVNSKIELLNIIGSSKVEVIDYIYLDNGKMVTVYKANDVIFGVRI